MQLQPGTIPEKTDIERLYKEREKLQQAQAAPSTVADYARDWAAFTAWCERMHRGSMPASPDTLSLYITDLLLQGRKVTTASRYAAGVAYEHHRRGLASPLNAEVRGILWGARRSRVEQPHQMQPITLAQLREIARTLAAVATPLAMRDRAIVVIGFASALRRSNLASLTMEDVKFCAQGVAIRVRREKQDPAGQRRRLIGLPYGSSEACPVRCLESWLAHRGRDQGPVFTRLDAAAPRLAPLSKNAIWGIVKRAVARIGLDPKLYGPHSLRAGLITAAGERGVGPLVIASQSGHRSLDTLQIYFRPSDAFRSNCCAAIGL